MKCPFLENHACIRADGQYRLCCISLEDNNLETIYTHSPKHWLQSGTVSEARNSLARDEWPKACEKCRIAETRGQKSKRLNWHPQTDRIEYLDLRFSNQCNLQCQMCFPGSSSSLVKEHQQLLNKGSDSPWGKSEWQIYNWFDDSIVRNILADCQPTEVYLTGGEPFMVKGLPAFLDMLDSNVHVRFNTNATIHNPKLRKHLKRFNTVTITASVDGIGPVNDYIRWGSNWLTIATNLYEFSEFAHVNISPTIQVLNCLYYTQLKQWADNNNFTTYPNFLHYPYYHNIQNTPYNVREQMHSDLRPHCNSTPDINEINKFIYYTKLLDKNRNIDILDYLPELGKLYGFDKK